MIASHRRAPSESRIVRAAWAAAVSRPPSPTWAATRPMSQRAQRGRSSQTTIATSNSTIVNAGRMGDKIADRLVGAASFVCRLHRFHSLCSSHIWRAGESKQTRKAFVAASRFGCSRSSNASSTRPPCAANAVAKAAGSPGYGRCMRTHPHGEATARSRPTSREAHAEYPGARRTRSPPGTRPTRACREADRRVGPRSAASTCAPPATAQRNRVGRVPGRCATRSCRRATVAPRGRSRRSRRRSPAAALPAHG